MSQGDQIEAMFRARGIKRGGILFLRPDDALALTEAARQAQVRVLGVDAFRLGPGETQPLQEHSLDLSSKSVSDDPWTITRDFLRRQPSDLYFEVVLE